MGQDISNSQEVIQEPAGNKCINCGSSLIEHGYPTPLCFDCRQSFIKLPIPSIIKIFSLAIIAIVLIAMIRLPDNISLGIHQARGKKAFENRQYQTAQREFKNVLSKDSTYTEAKINFALASFYVQDYQSLITEFNELEGKRVEDENLYGQLSDVAKQLGSYLPSDSFLAMQKIYADSAGDIPVKEIEKFVSANPEDEYAAVALASSLFDNKEYAVSDSLLSKVLEKDPNHLTALALMTALKRENNQFNESIQYCDKLLSLNKESIYAMSSKARTLLKLHKDKDALQLALEARKIDKEQPYNLATLALAYHFNSMIKERDEIIANAKKDSLLRTYFDFADDVISNKIKFR